MKHLLQNIIAILAKVTLWRYCPMVVAITGSVGKTSTKDAIFTALKAKYRVRRSEKNFNTEIGVPLTILGLSHYGRNIFKWLFALFRAGFRVLLRVHEYPEVLVLEMGADRPGDIAYLTKLTRPLVGVITTIGEIPVHVEFFDDPMALAREKAKLIQALPVSGYAVLNADDPAVTEIAGSSRAHRMYYGFGEDADLRIKNYELDINARPDQRGARAGMRFQVEHGGRLIRIELANTFGQHQAYAAAAAVAVGLVFNMSLIEMAEALKHYESPPGRLKLLQGNKGTWILDDTYNASPVSTRAALDVLKEFPAKRRIAVLGDMLELGKYTEAAHRVIGDEVAEVSDLFFAVGERMKFAMNEAMAAGIENRRQLNASQAFWFATSKEVGPKLEAILQPGDVVLIKGSQSMRMERVVEEIMAEPQRAKELLVRQTVDWLRR